MSGPILEVKHLKKYFPQRRTAFSGKQSFVRAVDDVSFQLRQGEILGLVGESGSGKTTVGKTILNLLSPTGGAVLFQGQVLFDVEAGRQISKKDMSLLRRNMQMVFQDPYASLDPRMNVERIVTEGMAKFRTCPRERLHARAEELVQECGLEGDSLKKFPHQFSGGQRQRIGIARALSLEPKLIIADEPTAALDVSIQSQILNLMLSLKERHGMSYLFISHNLSIVEHFCTHTCVMYLGSIVEQAPTEALFRSPAHPYTAALLEATPSVKGRKEARTLLSGEIPSPANPPSGCKFHPRCPYAADICREKAPPVTDLGGGHLVACHIRRADGAEKEVGG